MSASALHLLARAAGQVFLHYTANGIPITMQSVISPDGPPALVFTCARWPTDGMRTALASKPWMRFFHIWPDRSPHGQFLFTLTVNELVE